MLMFLNMSQTHWYSNKQSKFESGTFFYKLYSIRATVEMVKALQYNLYMFGILINGPEIIFVVIGSSKRNM